MLIKSALLFQQSLTVKSNLILLAQNVNLGISSMPTRNVRLFHQSQIVRYKLISSVPNVNLDFISIQMVIALKYHPSLIVRYSQILHVLNVSLDIHFLKILVLLSFQTVWKSQALHVPNVTKVMKSVPLVNAHQSLKSKIVFSKFNTLALNA